MNDNFQENMEENVMENMNGNMNENMCHQLKHILFVDDEQYVLDGLVRLLREFRDRWHIHTASDGEKALELIRDHPIDMVVADVRMPGITGLQLLERLQADPLNKHIPVVILTGDHDLTLKRHALDKGAVDLLNKPICKEDIVARITNVLKLKESQDLLKEKNRQLENQLVQSQKMELIGIMAAAATHDVSNMLSVVVGYSSLFMEENRLKGDEAEGMSRISQAGKSASEIIERILAFSRADKNTASLNIAYLIQKVLAMLTLKLTKRVDISWEPPTQEIVIQCDPIGLQQVMMNLCLNALQAMEGQPEGKLMVAVEPASQNRVSITVTDTGPGIPPDVLLRIFDPLFTTKNPGKGTGLGLFVVKYIVDQFKGTVEVESRMGEGTTFRITLPKGVGK